LFINDNIDLILSKVIIDAYLILAVTISFQVLLYQGTFILTLMLLQGVMEVAMVMVIDMQVQSTTQTRVNFI
jgi:hypothetical protein